MDVALDSGAAADAPEDALGSQELKDDQHGAVPACPSLDGVAAQSGTVSKAEARRLRKAQLKEERRASNYEKAREKKRRAKLRKKEARWNFLGTMGAEERAAFLEKERLEAQAREDEVQAHMQRVFESGAPKVVVNCSFSGTMNKKELTSLAKQAQLCYTAVRDQRSGIQLHFTSLDDDNPSWPWFVAIGHKRWKVHWHRETVWDLFAAEKLVVLSPDADEDLDEVRDDHVYVVGGLVDRSVQKMQTRSQAEAQTGSTCCIRRLPIKRFGPAGHHPVLNIDVVVRILAERLRRPEEDAWPSIFADCLPQRHRGATVRHLKRQHPEKQDDGDEADGDSSDEDSVASGDDDQSA